MHTYKIENTAGLIKTSASDNSEAFVHPDRPPALDLSSRVLLRDGDACHWIRLQDIAYFESCANHTIAFWNTNKAFIYCAIGKIELRLPSLFFRVSRQHIVNVESVNHVELWVNGGYRLCLATGAYIEVSRRNTKRFKDQFSF
jgi:two-component system, LytTR family, response regulator